MLPGIVGVLLLASAGGFNIILESEGTETISIVNGTTGIPITNSTITHSPTTFTLQNPVWITFNGMIFILYFLYIIVNVINLLRLDD